MERSTKLRLSFYLGLILAIQLFLPVRSAYAEIQQPWNTVIYGPVQSGGLFGQPVYNDVGVCAWTRYNAAMTALGYSSAEIDGLSSDVKAKLSNQSTGGRFWTFAQLFEEPSEDDLSMHGITFRSYVLLYGEGNVWRGQYTSTQANDARTDADVIIGGGSLGGGGSGGSSGDSGEVDGDSVYFTIDQFTGYTPSEVGLQGIVFTSSQWDTVLQYQAEHNPDGHLFLACGGYAGGSAMNYFTVAFTTYQPKFYGNEYRWGDNSLCSRIVQKTASDSLTVVHGGKKYYRMQDSDVNTLNTTNAPQFGGVTDACRPCYGWYYNGPSSDIVVPLTTIKSVALLDYAGQTYGFGASNYQDFPYRFAATIGRGYQKSYQTADYKWVFAFRKYQNGSNLAIPTVSIFRKDGFSIEFNDDGSAKKINGTSVYNNASGATTFGVSDLKDGMIEKTVAGSSYGAFSFTDWTFAYAAVDGDSLDSDPVGPPLPPSNWPTEPTPNPPTSPTVPDPPTSTPVDPPSDPVGGNPPSFPTQIITTGTTYPVADLQAVLDAMAEHCEHIRDEIYADTSGLYDNLTTFLANQFQVLRNFLGDENNWLMESLENEFQRMMDYLKDLAEWLADQMEFDISGGDYDDSTVVSWLRRIYLKLGTGGVSTKPVDPVADPVGAWDWLAALINNILSALAGGAAALTGTLGELFNGIRTKFPFSIPWDVVAIVTLFDAAPVTPAFTIAYTVFGANVRYDIDLHFFDEQAAVIRAVENVLFCAYLLFKTNWLVGIFDGFGDFLGGKLRSTVKSP